MHGHRYIGISSSNGHVIEVERELNIGILSSYHLKFGDVALAPGVREVVASVEFLMR